jgi:hypothetical protein
LAEQLAAADKKDLAGRIYIHLRDTRTDAEEQYVREAAERALRTAYTNNKGDNQWRKVQAVASF